MARTYMPLYSYKAINREGKEFLGEHVARDKTELAKLLRDEGKVLVTSEDTVKEDSGQNILSTLSAKFEALMGVGFFEKVVFSRNLSVMIHAGLPLSRSLTAIAEETKNNSFKKILLGVVENITKGKSFADALLPYRDVFGDLFIHMVQAGEASGKLDQVLSLLSRQMKKDYDLRSRVRGAMIYPAIVITVLLMIGALMMIYVVPTLSNALKELNVPLPVTTKMIIFISDLFVNYALWVFLGVVVWAFLFFRFIRSSFGRPLWDTAVLRIPVFGVLIKKMNVARMTRVLAYLLTSGVPILRSLEIAGNIVGNTQYKDSIGVLGKEVTRGDTMGAFFHKHSKLYDPIISEMVSAGEETGKTAQMLLEIAIFFEGDINETTKNLSSVIEPFLMVTIGIIVGFFALSVLQPIYGSLGNI